MGAICKVDTAVSCPQRIWQCNNEGKLYCCADFYHISGWVLHQIKMEEIHTDQETKRKWMKKASNVELETCGFVWVNMNLGLLGIVLCRNSRGEKFINSMRSIDDYQNSVINWTFCCRSIKNVEIT